MSAQHLAFQFNQAIARTHTNATAPLFPTCHLSTLAAGDMKTYAGQPNKNRVQFLCDLNLAPETLRYATQVHSRHILFFTDETTPFSPDTEADGIITTDKHLVPAVLVADCMPIFLYDTRSGAFGVLHSGWKGTGIAADALDLLEKRFGSKPSDVLFVFGPHIRSCCYTVDASRAAYFSAIEKTCVRLSVKKLLRFSRRHYSLSLAYANRALLERKGVPPANITDTQLCTCCTTVRNAAERGLIPANAHSSFSEREHFLFGSNCRENTNADGSFTRMIAAIEWKTGCSR